MVQTILATGDQFLDIIDDKVSYKNDKGVRVREKRCSVVCEPLPSASPFAQATIRGATPLPRFGIICCRNLSAPDDCPESAMTICAALTMLDVDR
jgi:hypothetical protein